MRRKKKGVGKNTVEEDRRGEDEFEKERIFFLSIFITF